MWQSQRSSGQELYYEDSRGDGPAIIFSHGLYMDHEMFAPQIEALRDSWRCITWDERAHGSTVTSEDRFTYWDSAADLVGLLDYLGIERAVLAGMSQGGYLSLRAALALPERVRALVLLDTQSGVEDPEKVAAYTQLLELWGGEDGPPQELLDMRGDHHPRRRLGEGTPAWQDKWRAKPVERVRQAFDTLVSREDDVTSRLGEITIPAIVVHGDADAAIDVASGAALSRGVGGRARACPRRWACGQSDPSDGDERRGDPVPGGPGRRIAETCAFTTIGRD